MNDDPHLQEDDPVGGVKWKDGLNGSSFQSITASPSKSRESASEKIVSVSILASVGISDVPFSFI